MRFLPSLRSVGRGVFTAAGLLLGTSATLSAQATCGTPGKDGPGGTLTGIVNTYYPGTASAGVGATSITIGASFGAAATITPGDLLLVIQMQDAAINFSNSSAYGAGTTTGSGSTALNNAGLYEYVTATNTVGAAGGTVTIRGTGAGAGLLNAYTNAAATGTQGQRRFQVIRVPQYSSATLSSGLTAGYWNGTAGGVLAIDVAGRMTLGGTVNVSGRGFRGGAGRSGAGGAGGANTDFVNLSTNPFHGIKGEGIAGTPRWVLNPQTNTNTDLGVEGYPSGATAQGAPANAGGGGTDGHPTGNDQNSGGGGGANGGAGGQGGFTWSSGLDRGGRGGTAFGVFGVGRVILGGGGGAGSRNNSVDPQNAGGAGGGIVLIRADTAAGTGAITANGLDGASPANDGAGGGGAGGSVVVLVNVGTLSGLSVQARGGSGGNAWLTQAGAASAHGPGGGGGGGVVVTSSVVTIDVAPGNRGLTTTGNLAFGADTGRTGKSATAALASSPGIRAGALCVPSLTVTKTTSTATVTNTPTGTTATYTIVVANAAGRDTARSVALLDTLPAGFTYLSSSAPVLAGGASRPSTANPAAGATAPAWTAFSIPAGGSVTQTFVATVTAATTNGTKSNPAWGRYLDPKRTTAAGTTAAAYDSSAAGEDVTVRSVDLTVAKTHAGSFSAGVAGTYTITPSNIGGVVSSGTITVVDTLPTGLGFSTGTGTGWTCGAVGQVVTCTSAAAIAAGGSANPITLTVSVAAGAVPAVTNRAWVSGGNEPAGALGNNGASDPTTVTPASADVVTTKTGPATITAGANATYTITALNNGPNAATGIVITDTLPVGAVFVSATGGGTAAGNVVTWPTVANLASGASSSVTVTVTYAAGGSYLDIAASTSTSVDPTPANNNGSAAGARVTTAVTASANVVTTKTGPASVTAGANATYTLTATNNGPSAATNVQITDTLPAGATFVSATGGGTVAGNVVTWPAVASIANGANTVVTVTVTYAAAGSYADIAASTATTADPVPANNNGSAPGARVTTTVVASADVATTKTGPASVAAGVSATYTVRATNNGPSAATGVQITDTLPAGATFVSATDGGTVVGNVVTWPSVASLASGASVNRSVTVTYAAAGSYTDIAASTSTTPDPTPANNNGSAAGARVTTTVSASADVATTQAGPATGTAGVPFSYTVTITNNGPSAALNVTVSDTLPAGLVFVSATGGGTAAGGVVTFPAIPSLASGASTTFTITVQAPAAGSYTAIAASTAATADPALPNNNGSAAGARVTTVIAASADVVTVKSGPASVSAGADAVYTITATNNGPSSAANVVVTDTLPAGATFVSASGGGTAAGGVVTWPGATVASGANLSFAVTVRYAAAGSYTDIAASTSTTADPTPANNNGSSSGARVTTAVTPSANLALSKTGPATASAGATVTYTIAVTNNGPTAATAVVLTDTLPPGTTFVSATAGGVLAGSVVTWPTIASLANGGVSSVQVSVVYPATGNYTDAAGVASPTPDPVPADNRATATTAVGTSADVATTQTGPATATAGASFTYTITVTNSGPSSAASIVVTDTLPAGLQFISATGGGTVAGNVVTFPAIASLASGASTTFTVTLSASAAGSYTSIAANGSGTPDPVPANNDGSAPAARVTTVVTASADIVTTKTGPATATAGANVSYTITALNNGPSAAATVVMSDTLPAGATFVSASGGGTAAGNVVTWPAVASLASGASVSVTVTVTYAAAGIYADIAASTSATPDPVAGNNDGSAPGARVSTTVGTSADVVTTKTGSATATAGASVSYTITAQNNGPSSAASVVIVDTLPAGATFVSATAGGTVAGGVVSWPAIASIPAGGSASVQVTVRYAEGGSYTDRAASTSATPDPVPGNNDGSAPAAQVTTVVAASTDLSITKTGPASGTAGTDLSYTITVTNNGPSTATSVVVTDSLPGGVTFVSATGGGTVAGSAVTWPAAATLADGASLTFTVVYRASAGGTFTDVALVSGAATDPTSANNRAVVTTVVGTSADVVTTKTGPATINAGVSATYTITATNNGPSAAATVVVTDTLPAGATFVSASAGGTAAGTVVTWPAVASLASGASATFTVTVTYAAGGSYTDIAASTSTTADPTPANNNGSAPAARVTTAVGAQADVATTKTGPATATAGQDLVYVVTVTNAGPSAATAVVVTDTLPAGLTFVSATDGGTVAGNVVTWPAIASLASGGSQSHTVVARAAAAGTYTDIVASTSATPDPNPGNNDGSAPAARVSTSISASADVMTTKTGPATGTAGQDIAYTLTTTNNGPSAAVAVVISDTLPAGLTFVSASNGGTAAGNVVTWPAVASLASGASVSYSLVARAAEGGSYLNIAASAAATADPTPANNNGSAPAARVTTVVQPSADVTTTQSGPATATAGVDFSYTVTVTNNGPSTALNVVVVDTLPGGLVFVSATASGTFAGGVVTFPVLPSLASGASATYTITVRASGPGTYTAIAANTVTTPDPNVANNDGSAPAARVTTVVGSSADLVTTKTGPATATAGQDISYTVTTLNQGPSAATTVVVTDTIPAGLVFISASNGGTAVGNVVTWPTVASLASGGSLSFSIVARAAEGGTYTNIAASASPTPDPVPTNNNGSAPSARAVTVIAASADVVTTKSGPAAATAGQNVSYTITAANQGPSTATNVVVTDTLPAGLIFVSASGGGTAAGNVVTWPTIASLANGASQSFTVTATATVAGSLVDIAASTATSPDPTSGNNDGSAPAARVTTVIAPSADLVTTKTGPATAQVGDDLVYTLSVTNNGPTAAANVVVTDTLPAGVTFVSATAGGTQSAGVVTWPTIGSLANGGTATFTVTLRAATAGTVVNLVAAASTTTDPNLANNDGSAPASRAATSVSALADVVTTKSGPATATAGLDINYTITVANNGPSSAVNVVVTDTLPAGLTFVSASGGATIAGNVVTWPAIASLAGGANQSFTVVARATDAGSYTNIAASQSPTADPAPGNNDGSAPAARAVTVVAGSADLVTTKTGPATATAGQDVTYTITTLNNGPSASSSVVVTDTLAAGATFVSASNGGTLAGNVVTWPTVASLASGASVSYTVTVQFAAAGGFVDIAASTAATADPVPGNNDGSAPAASVITVVGASADLVTTKSGPPAAPAGQDVTYTISTVNNGPSAATSVVVVDSLPSGATFVSASNGGTVAGGVVSWPAVASLANGGTLSYTVVLRFTNPGNYLDVAASSSATPDPAPTNNDGSPPAGRVNTAIGPSADVVTTKTGPATGTAGQDLVYTITVQNNGPTPATAVVTTDTLPAGFVFVSATGGGTLSGNVITWPAIATLANGASQAFTVTARATTAGSFVNLAATTASSPDPDLGNNDGSAPAARVTTVIGVAADIAVTKAGPAAATVGQDITYQLTVSNAGPSAAAAVIVTDTLPAGVTFVSATAGGTLSGSVVTWPAIGSLASGSSLTFSVTVRAAAPGSYLDVAAGTSSTADPNPANNNGSGATSRVTTVVSNNADLAVSKTGPVTALAGQDVVYQIGVANSGPAVATNVVVTDTLPVGATFVSASAGGTAVGGVVSWPAVPSLASGATLSYIVTIRLPGSGTFQNVAAATSPSPDPSLANNRAVAPTTVAPPVESADVVTTKTGPATITAGADVVYTIQTINSGPSAAANVVITDTLPTGVTLVSATGGATLSGNVLTWPAIASLANGASVTFTVTLRAPASGTFTNIAASRSTTTDPNPGNNSGAASNSRVTTTVTTAADLVTTKSGPARAAADGQVTYTIVTRNNGPDAATNVVITDSLPAGSLFVGASNGGSFAGGVVTWPALASLANGASVTVTVTIVVRGTGSITNVARSASTTPDPTPGNNRGLATTTIAASADVATTKTGPARIEAGGQISYQIRTKNLGPNPATVVSVVDSLPAGVTFVSASNGGLLSGRVVAWPAIPTLAVNETVIYTLVVTAPATAGQVTNIVASTAETADPVPDNNDGTSTDARVTTDVAPIDLAIAKSHDGELIPGTVATYHLTVANVGPTPTTGTITVVDSLPSGLVYQSASGPGWSCSAAGRVVTCRYTTVPFAPGATTTITLKALVATNAPPTIVNSVRLSTPGDDAVGNNNAGTDQAVVRRIDPLVIEKHASRADVEIADVVDYSVVIRNIAGSEIPGVTVTDLLPKGFTYQRQTARADRIPIADPSGAPGPRLVFDIGTIGPNAQVVLTYRLKVGAGATLGDGTNRAQAGSTGGAKSQVAVATVRVARGVFTDRGMIIGQVFLADSARLRNDSTGIPGVRVYLEDGTSVVTDSEGKFNFYGIVSGLHVIKVDPTTVPVGGELVVLDSRNAGDPNSRFVDLKNGELHRADFAIRFADSVRTTVDDRRARGEVSAAIIDSVPTVALDAASDTAKAPAYRPLMTETSANPIDEANRLPVTRLPGSTSPLTGVPNGSIDITPARRALPADGNTAMAVRIRVVDQDRRPIGADQTVTLEASLGRWLATDLDPVEPGVQLILKNGEGELTFVASSEAGLGEIRVTNGLRVATAQLAFLPSVRPLMVNGLVEARIDLRSLLRDGLQQVTSADRFERELKDLRASSDDGKFSAAGRGALFLQGKVKGSTLLTLAFDTERDPDKRMFRDIQPDEFYPVYGDASIKEFGAQSFDRLYLRVDNKRSYALYGDYVTPSAGTGTLAARELGAYQRSLTGALIHAESRQGQANVFASRDRLTQVVEEIPGQGISGPYQLRRTDGRVNSESVELVTRDRNQPSRIVQSVPMTRFTDYTMEPFTGRLLFFTPVPSVDADLNPVSIRVRYEVERGGQEFWVYGVDGQIRINDRAEFGAGMVRDEQPLANKQLYSANAAVSLAGGTVLLAEVARTEGDSADFRGTAARFELRHSSARVQASAFAATSDAGFSNLSSTFQPGRSELGIRGSAAVGRRTRFIGEALRSEDKVGGGHRDGLLAAFERQFGRYLRAEVGYRYAQETQAPANPATSGSTPNETNAFRTRVTFQLPGQPRASVFGEFEQDLKESDQRRGAVGGQYVLFDRLRIYGRHEFLSSFSGPFAMNGAQKQATTVIGLDAGYARDGQFFGEYRGRDAFSGRETEAAIGLRNRWNLGRGLVVNTGLERIDVLKGPTAGEATALSAGVEYSTNPLWRGTARFEYRFAPTGDNLLATLGYVRKLNTDWTMLGRALYNTGPDGLKRVRNQLGFAWRQTDRNRWNGLARWENRYERLGDNGGAEPPTTSSNILSAHLNYQPTRSIWLSGRVAGKWETVTGPDGETKVAAQLASVRALYDFLPRWDAGLIGSTLWSGGRQYGAGAELGRGLIRNMRVALGYNIFGFRDPSLISDGAQTDRGLYLHLGFKFDEELFRK